MGTFLKMLGITFIVMIILAFIGSLSDSSNDYSNGSSSEQPFKAIPKWATWDGEGTQPLADVLVTTNNVVRSEYTPSFGNIYGLAYNYTGQKLSYIQIDYGIYNESGDIKLGSCIANQSNLAADTGWNFSAICTNLPSSAFTYKVDDVSYF